MNIDGTNGLACLTKAVLADEKRCCGFITLQAADKMVYDDNLVSARVGLHSWTFFCGSPRVGGARPRRGLEVAPLPHMYVVKDLVVDMANFYDASTRASSPT